jgi:hypothetical protein
VQVLFPDGSALDVDDSTSVDLQSPTLLRVTAGRVKLTVAGANNPSGAIRYQIDTPVASAMTDGAGEFRVALLSEPSGLEIELAVLRGSAALTTERGTMRVHAGERSLARDNEAPMQPQAFNSARFDAFDLWSAARRSARMGSAASAQYLPSDLQMYGGTLDRSGAWQYEAPYGYVWYPTVDQDWRPYYDGYWSSIRPYGWTWIGFDVWAWPTHHYGRWGLARDRWFWIPERHWNAAWVSWGAAPGYVSWCPLGFDNRPVIGPSVTLGNSWGGWVVVPRTHFGWSNVRQWAIPRQGLPATTPFVVQASAPVPPPMRSMPHPTVAASSSAVLAIPRPAAGRTSQSAAGSKQPGTGGQHLQSASSIIRQPGTGGQPSAAGIRRPGIDSQPSAAGIRRPGIDSQPSAAGIRRPGIGSQPSAALIRPTGAGGRQLSVMGQQPPSGQRQPAVFEPTFGRPAQAPTAPSQPARAAGAWPRTAVPRTESSASSLAPARRDPAPRAESPPVQTSRPSSPPAPATAAPRSGPPAAAARAAAARTSSGSGTGGTGVSR